MLLNTAEEAMKLLEDAEGKRALIARTPLSEILAVIDRVGRLWQSEGEYFRRALEELSDEIAFSKAMIEQTLRVIPVLCNRTAITKRLAIEFGDAEILDRFIPRQGYAGRVHAAPYGTVLHVAAGNVFIGCIDSLLNGFVTKNVSIMKLSGKNQRFPVLFAQSIIEADPYSVIADKFSLVYWPGGKSEVEDVFKSRVNAIIAWGGQEMIASYRRNLGAGTVLIEHGPKISFQAIFKNAFEGEIKKGHGLTDLAEKIATDVSLWDQSACSSPQTLFIQDGIDLKALMEAVGNGLSQAQWERGTLSDDEHVEILKERSRAVYNELLEGGAVFEGQDWLLSFDPTPGLRASPLNRTLIIKRFKTIEDLGRQISPYSAFLQTCGYLAADGDHEALLIEGAAWGLSRFAPIGQMMTGMEGSPHDGRYSWVELTRMIPDENRGVQTASDHISSRLSLKKDLEPGYVFSSGGTSGQPKFAYYSYGEFDAVAKMLSRGLSAQGIGKGTLCANLFVAGNLWSSFLAVDRALVHCQAQILPIGGNADPDLILKYLVDFRPDVIVGLPSLLISLLNRGLELGLNIEISQLCYAGEHLNVQARRQFENNWKTRRFGSAGYASVDAGPIGYQCGYCGPGEHHLFSDFVDLEIIEDEAVVTSLVRQNMPVVRLKTGDQVSWGEPQRGCLCGSKEPKFVLHGRCDGQMNVWSCRVLLVEVEAALLQAGIDEATFQMSIREIMRDGVVLEQMTVFIETDRRDYKSLGHCFALQLHRLSKDVHATHSVSYVEERVALQSITPGGLPRVARTGKLPRILDLREK
ncbi:acyl-CoA reductase [Bdellovibrionota bacterium FG-1]